MKFERVNNPLLIYSERELPRWVAVVGTSGAGPDIAAYLKCEIPELHLVLVDDNQAALDRAVEDAQRAIAAGCVANRLPPELAEAATQNVFPSTDYEALAYCDWVIEAAPENLDQKRRILARVESAIRNDALITSNTGFFPASQLFAQLAFPERATVARFFTPVLWNPAVEIVTWGRWDPEIVDYLRWLLCLTGKVPLVAKDSAGFTIGRLWSNWCNEAAVLLGEATPAQVDTVAGEFALLGPFQSLNLSHGNAQVFAVQTLLAEGEGVHQRPPPALSTTREWETLRPGEQGSVSRELHRVIRDQLLGVLLSQSLALLDRQASTREDLEAGCRMALGLRKGPLQIAGELGEADVRAVLGRYARRRPDMPLPGKGLSYYRHGPGQVLVDDIDGVKIISLRRPETQNALDADAMEEILSLIERHESDPATQGFVITGFGPRVFCAGSDLGDLSSLLGDRERAADWARDRSRLLIHLDSCPKPVIAALNGTARGVGLELAIRCHGRVATRNAWMQFPEITLGIVPGMGALAIPYRRWPEAAATFHNMLTRAEELSADRATDIGLVDTLVQNHAHLLPAAVWMVKELSGRRHRIPDKPVRIAPVVIEVKSPHSADGQRLSSAVLEILRGAIQAAAATSLGAALEIGYRAFGESLCTAAAKEGITAFGERRDPDFAKTG